MFRVHDRSMKGCWLCTGYWLCGVRVSVWQVDEYVGKNVGLTGW